ncbi:recombination mediator RecR [Pelagicoccus sp. SDUM812003]|uniref:recombination mediator RecR n=1 Tax=Pelagicoccus sp. SDUM812003 TaxID=3041267 RepID=UPI00280E279B|nr:recombination mediator RecR [Pelagicoccus sp. SDUM812003]MDQ8203723.1 recombination mediator RecR [Pelagicoccus sp. SDUM812003]
MTPAFEALQKELKRLPGVGFRSAERMAIYLLLERPEAAASLADAIRSASERVRSCSVCGNVCEEEACSICQDERRSDSGLLCVVEHVSDLMALEKSGAYRGRYHVLHGKLSPINGIGPERLNLSGFTDRLKRESIEELILALPNDVEGEATSHYLTDLVGEGSVKVSRIGFGLPSGASVLYADTVTLKSALEARKAF